MVTNAILETDLENIVSRQQNIRYLLGESPKTLNGKDIIIHGSGNPTSNIDGA